MAKIKLEQSGVYSFFCPGCGHNHCYFTDNKISSVIWGFNGDVNNPTFTPSLLNRTGSFAKPSFIDPPEIPPTICHLFVTNGVINYCGGCTHSLSGKSVPMEEVK